MAENKSASTIGVISVSVPANTPTGNYSIGVSGVELATEGQNNDNAWMKSGSASAQLTIKAPKALDSISVKTAPTKTSYIAGQNFDSTGMVIEKKYNDDSTATATGWTVTDGTNLTTGKTSVTISYTEGGVTKTTTQAITVTAKAVSSIAVKTQPSKTVYNAGESFNAAGMVITVTYNDGSSEDISTGFTVSPSGALKTSDTTVTISYGGKTATVSITVNAVSVTGVSLNKSSTTIKVGNSETLTATVAPANATNKNVTWSSNNASVATVDQNGKVTGVAEGTATITVTTADGSGVSATCKVTVTKKDSTIVTPGDDTGAGVIAGGAIIGALGNGSLPFNDVTARDYFYDAVKWAVDQGITSGTSRYTFSPDAPCTRAQVVTFLWRAAGCPQPSSKTNPFTDVRADDYFYDAVLWAVENGITNGTSAKTFSPDATVTRAQVVTFLWRANGQPAAGNSGFLDVSSNAYYARAVDWAFANGITTGVDYGAFGPDTACTRAQIVTFLYRAR